VEGKIGGGVNEGGGIGGERLKGGKVKGWVGEKK